MGAQRAREAEAKQAQTHLVKTRRKKRIISMSNVQLASDLAAKEARLRDAQVGRLVNDGYGRALDR